MRQAELVSWSTYSYTLKMELIYLFETSVGFERTTWRYIPEDVTVHNHRFENPKSYNIKFDHNEIRFQNVDWIQVV
jgi:hypothetical protein